MAQVVIRNLGKSYGEVAAVRDVSLDVSEGEFLVLVGPSGCGKTTTLRMIAGLEDISDGEIWIGDRMVNELPPKARDIAMVFQNYALYPHMSVFENLAFGLRRRKLARKEIEQRVREAAEILSIQELLQRKPRQLSGGQRQRVALGRAIVRHPQVFLFDEPLSNLDAKLRVQMRVELKRLHGRIGATAIYVTHDQVEAMTLGDRVVVMCDGTVQQVGSPIELYRQPANRFVAGFIGSPAMNFLQVSVEAAEDGTWVQSGALRLRLGKAQARRLASHGDRQITLGVRPENLRIAMPGEPTGSTFGSVVAVVEQLGSDLLLDLDVGGSPMTARVDPLLEVTVDQPLRLSVDLDRLHFFDPASGMTL